MKILDTVFVQKLVAGEKLTWHGRYHSHSENEYEIHYFVEGEGSFLSNKTRYTITKGALFLSAPHEFHSIVPQRVTKPLTYYAVLFSIDEKADNDVYQLLTQALASSKGCLHSDKVNRFSLDEVLNLCVKPGSYESIAASFLFASYLYRWYSDEVDGRNESVELNAKAIEGNKTSKAYVTKAVALMKEKNILVEDIAWKLGLSAEHFIRIFKSEMNITPHQYSVRLRVQDAATRLVSSEKTIGKIASELAFENQFHFSRVFKKCTGFSPTEYRRHYGQEVDLLLK